MSVFNQPVYWTTDLGQFEASGFRGDKGADGMPYRLVLVRRYMGQRWREFEQIKLDRAANPDVAFEQWRYRLTGHRIVPGDQTLMAALTRLPVAPHCGHAYFPVPDGVGQVLMIDGRWVCAPCSDESERRALRNPHHRASFEFQLETIPSSLQLRVTTANGGLVGVATVSEIEPGTNPGGLAWTRRNYIMRDVHDQVWHGTGGATTGRAKFRRPASDKTANHPNPVGK